MTTLPALFVSHGSPMIALEPGATGAFLRRLGPVLRERFGRPRAIVAVSAHTLTPQPVLLAGQRHEAVYDFGGFPDELYRLRYDAAGAPALAPRVAALLRGAGLAPAVLDRGGLDHGIWTPLRYLFPDAEIPVLPLGFDPHARARELMALGAALAPLADEGVLVMASGSLTHNLRLVFGPGGLPPVDAPEIDACRDFRAWVHDRATSRDWDALADYREQAPHAVAMHPSDEHWLPFYVAAGVGGDAVPRRLHAGVTHGCIAMDLYAFGAHAAALDEAGATIA